jgi:hypothetical protein
MKLSMLALTLLATPLLAPAQAPQSALLAPGMTLPITFSKTLNANHAHPGDRVEARTTQPVRLTDGSTLPSGSHVIGHVVSATGFKYDDTPYAKQPHSVLAIHFDSVETAGKDTKTLPLQVYVRALADPVTVEAALTPNLYDDSLHSRAQVGGDIVTPSQKEVVSQQDEVVGYLKHGNVYAHLLPASGNRSESCDGCETEVSMGVFSANACGLYGFTDATLAYSGKTGEPSTFTLVSNRRSPEIWAHSAALLEVVASSPTDTVASSAHAGPATQEVSGH